MKYVDISFLPQNIASILQPEPVQISTQLTSTLDRPPISLQDVPIRLRLVSPTDLSQIHHSYSNYEHQAYATLIGDDVGKVKVKSNKDLKGFIAVDLSNHLTSGEVSFVISKNNSLEIDLKVDCQITPEVRTLVHNLFFIIMP